LQALRLPTTERRLELAPAFSKYGGLYALVTALGSLAASGKVEPQSLRHYEFLGELALTDVPPPVSGALPGTIASANAECIPVVPRTMPKACWPKGHWQQH